MTMRKLKLYRRYLVLLFFLLMGYSSVAQSNNYVVNVSCKKSPANSSVQQETCIYDTIVISGDRRVIYKENKERQNQVFERDGRYFQIMKSCERLKSDGSNNITSCKYDTVEISETEYLLLTKKLSIPNNVQVECEKPKQEQKPYPNCYVILAGGSKVPIREYIKAIVEEKAEVK